MHYAPWGPAPQPDPHVLLNGEPIASTQLTLTNWAASSTPPPLIADTTLETVLRFLNADGRCRWLRGVEVVTCPRFDAGSLLALWAMIHPEEALAHAEQLVRWARAAEFGVADGEDSGAFVCTVNAYLNPQESPLGSSLRESAAEVQTSALFVALLPQLGAMLANIRDFDLLWFGEYSDVLQSDALYNSGAVQIESIPALDLTVLDTPLGLHPLVKYTVTAGRSRLFTVRSENTYSLEYRYESWVQYQSYRPLPRLSLNGLATRLNVFERREGHWRSDPITEARPRLFLTMATANRRRARSTARPSSPN